MNCKQWYCKLVLSTLIKSPGFFIYLYFFSFCPLSLLVCFLYFFLFLYFNVMIANKKKKRMIIIIKNTWSTRNRILHIIPSWLTCCSEPAFRFLSVAWWKLYGPWGVGRLKEGRSWDLLKKLVNNSLPWSKKRIPHNQINWFSVNYKAFSTMKKLLKKFCEIFQKKISRFLLKESIKQKISEELI